MTERSDNRKYSICNLQSSIFNSGSSGSGLFYQQILIPVNLSAMAGRNPNRGIFCFNNRRTGQISSRPKFITVIDCHFLINNICFPPALYSLIRLGPIHWNITVFLQDGARHFADRGESGIDNLYSVGLFSKTV